MKVCLVIIAVSGAGSFAAANAAEEKVSTKKPAAAIRTIDAITIEGEIAVPQVLFITSRDNRRYRDGVGKQYRPGTLDIARSLRAPDRLCTVSSGTTESLKEE
jgi:hypothetical protein